MVERDVFEYVSHLKSLIELERDEQRKKAIAEIRDLSGEDRERYGKAILNLSGKILKKEHTRVVFRFGRNREIKTDITLGDVVIVSNGSPLKAGFQGIVVNKGSRFIDVEFVRYPSISMKNIRIDLFYDDTTFRRMEENLDALDKYGLKVINLIFGYEEVYGQHFEKIIPNDRSLNTSQIDAVSKALGSPDFFVIHGPFGTGKTRTLAEYIIQEVNRGNSILATAESNVAVDNLVERLAGKINVVRVGHPSRINPGIMNVSLDNLMKTHYRYAELGEIWDQIEELYRMRDKEKKPVPSLRRGLSDEEIVSLSERDIRVSRGIPGDILKSMAKWIQINESIEDLIREADKIEKEIANEIITNADTVVTTNSTAFIVERVFDIAVVDEASQATVPSILIPLNKANKFVIAGDHKQLPPTVLNFRAKELEVTLFELLIQKYPFKSEMLTVQYRCNKNIADFPSQTFYNGRIKTHVGVKRITLKDLSPKIKNQIQKSFAENSLIFITTSSMNPREIQKRGSKSFFNPIEVRVVEKIVEELVKMDIGLNRIGVISPYDDQVRMLRDALDCEVKTVDGFQGREKDVIIISFVRSNSSGEIGFLKDYRRLNVSITRAKRLLIMVGNDETLSSDPVYRRLIRFVENRGKIIDANEIL